MIQAVPEMIKIGIDLGGTKIEGIAFSETGDELFRHRIATPQGDYSAILRSIVELIRKIESSLGDTGSVGICTPGSLSPATGLMRNSNSVCMNGKAVLDDLQDLLQREIRIANDANCFALSEAVDGVAKEADVVFGVIIGTGTGAGIVIDKKVLLGQLPVNGGIIRCPGHRISNCLAQNVIVANQAASKPGCPGRAWCVIMCHIIISKSVAKL